MGLRAPRYWHVDDYVRRNRILVGELFADLHAGVVHDPLIEDAVRTGEIHPLEHAMRRVVRVRQPRRFESIGPELDDLARLQVSDEPVTGERIEADVLGGDHHAVVAFADAEGSDREGIPDRLDA